MSNDCGPDYIIDDPRYPALLAEKKADLRRQGYPEELISLLDRGGRCVARILQSPDGFTLKDIGLGRATTIAWSQEEEEIARTNLANKTSTAYYKFHVARTFSCCNEPSYDQRPDWDANLGLNTSQAIKCTLVGGKLVCQ